MSEELATPTATASPDAGGAPDAGGPDLSIDGDFAGAVAAMKAATKPGAGGDLPEETTGLKPTADSVSETPKPVPAAEGTFDAAAVLSKIAKLEHAAEEAGSARDAHASRVAELEAKLADASQYQSLAATDPLALLQKLGLTPDAVADYVTNGPKKADPKLTALEQKQAQLDAALAKIQEREEAGARDQRTVAYKTAIPAQLESEKGALPHLHAFYETPADLANAVFEHQMAVYAGGKGEELTPLVAAKRLESALVQAKTRFAKLHGIGAAAAGKPPARGLTNQSPVAAAPKAVKDEDLSDDDLLAAAVATLRQGR